VEGVSTRRFDDIVKTMGAKGISESQVSAMANKPNILMEAFRNRQHGWTYPLRRPPQNANSLYDHNDAP
jgi:transposase-like protein